jgi:hypothetical protein
VTEGALPVRVIECAMAARPARVTLAGMAVAFEVAAGVVTLKQDVVVKPGQELVVEA